MNNKKGYTLIELLVTVLITAILAGAVTLNSNIGQPTAKGVAEKIAASIHRVMTKAERIHDDFTIELRGDDIWITWKSKGMFYQKDVYIINIPNGFSIERNNFTKSITYSSEDNTFDVENTFGTTFTVFRDNDKSHHYIVFYREGRMRTSPTPPSSWK